MGIFNAIAGPAIGLASNLFGMRQSRRNTQMTNRANREMAELAYQRDVDFWNMQNAYNHPAKQMQRFEEAGLNKHLIYGQGTPGNAQNLVRYNAPSQNFMNRTALDPSEFVGEGLDLLDRKKNIDLKDAQKFVQKAQELNIMNDATLKAFDINLQRLIKSENNPRFLSKLSKAEKRRLLNESNLASEMAKYKTRLVKNNINPNDDAYLRVGIKILEALGFNVSSILN